MNAPAFRVTPSERAALEAEIRALRRQLDDMAEERDYWRDEAKQNGEQRTIERLQIAFKLTNSEAAVLASLYRRNGAPADKQQLVEVTPLYDHVEPPNPKITDVRICRLRAKLGAESIETLWGRGYFLTRAGIAKCAEVLA